MDAKNGGPDGQNRIPEKGLRPVWRKAFLAALRETGIVRDAYEAADVSRTTAYEHRQADDTFRAEWDSALEEAADLLEREAVRRARIGVKKPVIYQGQLCGVWVDGGGNVVPEGTSGARHVPLSVTEYSDALLIFLLKGVRPGKYKDRANTVVVTEGNRGNVHVYIPDNGRGEGVVGDGDDAPRGGGRADAGRPGDSAVRGEPPAPDAQG